MLNINEKQRIAIKTIECPGNHIPFFPKLWKKPNYNVKIPRFNIWRLVKQHNQKPNPTFIDDKSNKKIKPLKHLTWLDYLRRRYGGTTGNNSFFNKLNNKK